LQFTCICRVASGSDSVSMQAVQLSHEESRMARICHALLSKLWVLQHTAAVAPCAQLPTSYRFLEVVPGSWPVSALVSMVMLLACMPSTSCTSGL